jgi:FtsP/CotA-like multicopper oxidase with cupredoxin domain
MASMTRRTWLLGCGSAIVGLLAVARQASLASPSTATADPLAPTSTTSHHAATEASLASPAGSAAGETVASAGPALGQPPGLQTAQLQLGEAGAGDPNALRIPPLLSPAPRAGVRTVDTFGINQPYLGPTLRATQGDAVAFAIENQIGEPTTLHWHGMHLPAAMDGGPHQEIAPGDSWQPRFSIHQQAATLWFHSHLMGRSRAQVTRGLASLFILDDDNPAQQALPHSYGQDDIPLVLQEYNFGGGRGIGQTLVNGSLGPVFRTAQARLRLRLLNASDQRIYTLGFAGDVPFWQVASDGGLLPEPVRLTRLALGPAERAEIVLDLADAPGEAPVVLQNLGGFGGGGRGGNPGAGGQGATLLSIQGPGERAARGAGLPPLPARLNTIERLDPASAAVTRQMVLGGGGRGGRTINGQTMASTTAMHDMASALRVRLGDVERWNVVNSTRETHLFHVHDVQFQILERNGNAPGPTELGRKDTVLVRPADTPYMFHCHILQHEDQGMMGQFVVVPA